MKREGLKLLTLLVFLEPVNGWAAEMPSHNTQGIQFAKSGNHHRASLEFELAYVESPNSAPILNNMGNEFAVSGKWLQANDFYDRSIAINGSFLPAIFNKANILKMQRLDAQAEIAFSKIIKDHPEHFESIISLTRLKLLRLDLDGADVLIAPATRLAKTHFERKVLRRLKEDIELQKEKVQNFKNRPSFMACSGPVMSADAYEALPPIYAKDADYL